MDKTRFLLYKTRMHSSSPRYTAVESFHFLPVESWAGVLWTVTRAGHLCAGPDYRVRRQVLNGHDLIFCLEGAGKVTVGARTWHVRAGEMAWLPGDQPHAHEADAQTPWTVLWLRVQGKEIETLRTQIMGRRASIAVAQGADLPHWFEKLFETLRWRSAHAELKINALVSDLFLLLAGHRADRQRSGLPDSLARLMAAISSQPARKWTGSEMCGVSRISASHLRRMFQRHLGTTPRGWLRTERILLAQKLLLASSAPISTIAERCGFADVFHFSRDFKRTVGLSPRKWRTIESGEASDQA